METRPYLTFEGNCAEAITVYEQAFSTKASEVTTFGDVARTTPGVPLPPDSDGWIMQATLPIGDNFIRMSDSFRPLTAGPSERVSVVIEATTAEIETAYGVLADGASIVMELGPTFFSPAHASLVDRFGVKWELAAFPEQ